MPSTNVSLISDRSTKGGRCEFAIGSSENGPDQSRYLDARSITFDRHSELRSFAPAY
jgi:hypothetical protein